MNTPVKQKDGFAPCVPHVMLDAISENVFYLDSQLRIRWANQAAFHQSGLSAKQLLGMHCHTIWAQQKTECTDCRAATMLKAGETVEGKMVCERNHQWHIRKYAIRPEETGLFEETETEEEPNDPIRLRESLRYHEQLFYTLAQTCPDGITLTDLTGRVLRSNKQAALLFGYASDHEMCQDGINAFDYVVQADRARAYENMYNLLHQGEIRAQTYRIQTKNGHTLPVELSASLVKDDQGHPKAFISVIRDISKTIKAQEEYEGLQIQVLHTQKVESLGVMASGIAHDFNNLLMAIMGNISLARIHLSKPAVADDYLNKSEITSQHAAKLTQQLLTYAGNGKVQKSWVNLSQLILEMTDLLKLSLTDQICLQHDCPADLPLIQVDPTQIRQVIMNLVINSSEAIGDDPGKIHLSTGLVEISSDNPARYAMVEELKEGSFVYLKVTDTGCGMPQNTQARVFDPFFSTKLPGRGLGLAAVLGVVRNHRGNIYLTSKPSCGSTIQVLFPTDKRTFVQNESVIEQQTQSHRQHCILVIEDDQTVLEVTQHLLLSQGYQVYTAQDGPQGIDLFQHRHQEINWILMDISMPKMSCKQTIQELKGIKPEAKIVLTSGYNREKAALLFQGISYHSFIQKPFHIQQLLKILDLPDPS